MPTSRCLARPTALSDSLSLLGRVAEWFKAPVLKTGVPARVPWVRIPPLPPRGIRGLFAVVGIRILPHSGPLQARLLLKRPLHPQGIPSCNLRLGGVNGVYPGRFLWCRRLNAFGR